MKKKDIVDDAINDLFRLFSPNGTIPTMRDLRDLLGWVYDKGKVVKKT